MYTPIPGILVLACNVGERVLAGTTGLLFKKHHVDILSFPWMPTRQRKKALVSFIRAKVPMTGNSNDRFIANLDSMLVRNHQAALPGKRRLCLCFFLSSLSCKSLA